MRQFPAYIVSLICLHGLCSQTLLIQASARQVAGDTLSEVYPLSPAPWAEVLNDDTPFDEETLARLEVLAEHPINLNQATLAELLTVPFLDEQQAQAILRYRQQHGMFKKAVTLRTARLLSPSEYRLLSRSFTVATSPKKQSAFSLTLIQAAGRKIDLDAAFRRTVEAGGYAGSPSQLYTRLAVSNKRFSLRLALEKDPGETFAWQPNQFLLGFDHVSGTIIWKSSSVVREVLLGDFHVLVGQGLMLWRNTGQGKGTAPLSAPIRPGNGIKAGASREENRFLRGIAITLQPTPRFVARLFASRRKLDAALSEDTGLTKAYVMALGTSGLHRTAGELARQDQLEATITGASFALNYEQATLGLSGYASRFSHSFMAGNRPEDYYDFTGDQLAGISLHGNIKTQTLRVFGELARSFPGTYALIAGVRWRLHPRTSILGVVRVFSRQYQTLYGKAFADQRAKVQNETGWYTALETELHPYWTTSFYADFYQHPWVTFKSGMPRQGFSAFCKLDYTPRNWFTAQLLYRFESDQMRAQAPGPALPIRHAMQEKVHILRFQTVYAFSHLLKLRIQFDRRVLYVAGAYKQGSMLIQDVIWQPNASWRIQLRLSGFTSNGGASTLYAYENDLRYRFTIRAFTGTGSRNFLLLRKRVGTHIAFEVKYGTTLNRQISNTEAGVDLFPGKRIREVQAQFIWHV
ncbi:MAG: helix-hairpin-helix domain-containing protein [Bacteroidota bacterium]